MTSRTRLLLLLLPLVSAAACGTGGDKVNIGDTAGGQLTDYAASWDGYTEAFRFDPNSDRIRLVLDASGQGTLQVGDQALLPPPTDPNVGYPNSDVESIQPALFPGFLYPVYGARVESKRIQLSLNPRDIERDWCALQTPVLDTTNSTPTTQIYHCLPNWGYKGTADGCEQMNPDTGEFVPVDCRKLAECELPGSCQCTASACAIEPSDITGGDPAFDAALETDASGTALVGTLAIDAGTRITVRMTHQ